MKRRLLLLGVAVASLGAILVSGAVSNPTGTDNTPLSSNVGVLAPQVEATFQNEPPSIPANGTPVFAGDVFAKDVDAGYSMDATLVSLVTPASQQTAACGTIATTVTDGTGGALTLSSAGFGSDVGDLNISIAPAGTDNLCVVGGAVVKVDVIATGP